MTFAAPPARAGDGNVAGAAGPVGLLVALATLVGCATSNPVAPPPVTASFVTPHLFHLAIAGEDDAEAPALRQRFHAEARAYAQANGCTSYRIMRETFVTSANINPHVSTGPSWVFGRRPTYVGLVDCGLPDPDTAAQPAVGAPPGGLE